MFIVSVHFAQPRSSSLLKHVSPDLSAADDEEREGFQIQLATEGAGTARLPNRGPTDQTGKAGSPTPRRASGGRRERRELNKGHDEDTGSLISELDESGFTSLSIWLRLSRSHKGREAQALTFT